METPTTYEVYPQLNQSAVNATRSLLGKQLSKEFADQQKSIRAEQGKTDKVIQDGAKVNSRVRTKAVKDEEAEVSRLSSVWGRFNDKLKKDSKDNEGSLHKLATQFRTIGTVARGIGLGVGVLSSFSLLQDALGGIIAAGPIAAAGIALIPPAIAAAGAEAIVLRGAFKGVGKAVSDAFDPTKAKQFAQDLKGLSPSARSFVQEIAKAKGVLPNIQQTFFSQPQMQQAAKNVRGFFEGIKGNFKNLIGANGNLFGSIGKAITGSAGTKNIDSFLGSLSTFIRDITPGLTRLTSSFLNFIDRVAGDTAGPGGHKINGFFDKMAGFLDRVDVPGLLEKAGAAFHGFGIVLHGIESTVGGIIKAFGGTDQLGAHFFKNIGGLFTEIGNFTNSGTGQTFLHQLVGTLDALSGLSNTVVKTGLTFLANVFAGLYPAIKPFVAQVDTLVKTIFTPEFGQTIGKIASDFLNFGTYLLQTVNPALKDIVNFMVAHPKVLEGIAIGITAIWVALKVSKGVSQIATGINSITLALDFFKNPKKVLAGMSAIAGSESAGGLAGMGAAGDAVAKSWLGPVGLVAALAGIATYLNDNPNNPINKGLNKITDKLLPGTKGLRDDTQGKQAIADVKQQNAAVKKLPYPSLAIASFPAQFAKNFGAKNLDPMIKYFTKINKVVNDTDKTGVDFAHSFPAHITAAFTKISGIAGYGINNLAKAVKGFPAAYAPVTSANKKIGENTSAAWAAVNKNTEHGQEGVGKTLGKYPHLFTGPMEQATKSSTTESKSLWNHIESANTVGQGAVKKQLSSYPGAITGPITKANSGATTETQGMWKHILSAQTAGVSTVKKGLNSYPGAITGPVTQANSSATAQTNSMWKHILAANTTGVATTKRTMNPAYPGAITGPVTQANSQANQQTKSMWDKIKATNTSGVNDAKVVTGKLPAAVKPGFQTAAKNASGATATAWNDVGKKTAAGVHNVGRLSSQLPTTANPGVKGLVNVYSQNITKVWNQIASALKLKTLASVAFSAQKASTPGVAAPALMHGLATGGMIDKGYGGPTQDNVYLPGGRTHPGIAVSGGEFVVRARSVERIEKAAPGYLNSINQFADGGLVKRFAKGGAVSSGGVAGALAFLESIANRVPYVLGANGPNAFDCSSLVGNVWARLVGAPINRRYFVTGTEEGWLLGHGFSRGGDPSGFTVGLTSPPEHTVGILAGHRFEAAHTGTRMRLDGAAANAMNFSKVFHLGSGFGGFTGITPKQVAAVKAAAAKEIPGNSLFAQQLRAIPDQGMPKLAKVANDAAKKALASLVSIGGGDGGSGSAQIAAWIQQASRFTSIPASWVPGIETIINRESGGNPNAINRTDSNAQAGHPSQGLMQTIPSTFYANVPAALRGFGILNPVANIAAAVNYIKARYGSIFNVQQANPNLPPRGYRTGTSGATRGWAMVGEEGPEMVNFGGGETVLNNSVTKMLHGYAKGTKLPTSLVDAVRDISTRFVKSSSSIKTAVDSLTNKISDDIHRRSERRSLNKLIEKTGSRLEKLSTKLADNNKALSSSNSAKASLTTSVRSHIGALGDLTQLKFDPYDKGGAAQDFVNDLGLQVTDAKKYASNIKKVKKLGLSNSLISQLAASDSGDAIISSLASGSKSNISKINSLTGQINSLASSSATSVAGDVYNKTIKEQTKETKTLTKEMKRVADSLEKSVGKRLGIHRAGGGWVPHVPGISGDNVPILATAGEYVTPVGGITPGANVSMGDTHVYVDGVEKETRQTVDNNNRKVIASLNRRSGR